MKLNVTSAQETTYAERLGWPAGAKVVIFHVDDVGMSHNSNLGAIKAVEDGVATSLSIMMPCPWAEDMIKWAIKNPKHDIGIHLTLTSEWKNYRWGTLTDPKEVSGLLDQEGKMWRSVPEVVTNASADEVKKEVKAQIDKAIAMGHNPSHIDTHMGTLYGHPSYVKVFFDVAEEYNIPANAIDFMNDKIPVRKGILFQNFLRRYPAVRAGPAFPPEDGSSSARRTPARA